MPLVRDRQFHVYLSLPFQIRTTFTFLTSILKDLKDTLKVATKVCLKKGDYELKDLVKKDAEDVFEADLEQLDFGDGEAAANHINNWVGNKHLSLQLGITCRGYSLF